MVITTPNLQPGGPDGSLFVWSLPFDLRGGPTRSTRLHVKLVTPFRAESLSMLIIIFILLLFLIDTRIFFEKAKLQYLSSKSEICQQYNGNHNTVSILTTFFVLWL